VAAGRAGADAGAVGAGAGGRDCIDIVLLSASKPSASNTDPHAAREGWNYLPGAGDDAEVWARGLTPSMFWDIVPELLLCETEEACSAAVAAAVSGSGASGPAAVSGSGASGPAAETSHVLVGAVSGGASAGPRALTVGDALSLTRTLTPGISAAFGADGAGAPAMPAVDVLLWPHEAAPSAADVGACAGAVARYDVVVLLRGADSVEAVKAQVELCTQRKPAAIAAASSGAGSAAESLTCYGSAIPACGIDATLEHMSPPAFAATPRCHDGVLSFAVPVNKPQYTACRTFLSGLVLPAVHARLNAATSNGPACDADRSDCADAAAGANSSTAAAGAGEVELPSCEQSCNTAPLGAPGPATAVRPCARVLIIATPSAAAFGCAVGASVLMLPDLPAARMVGARAVDAASAAESAAVACGDSSAVLAGELGKSKHGVPLKATCLADGSTEPGSESSRSLKLRMRACVAQCQVLLQNGSVPKNLTQELWRFVTTGG
jgi:hypothetical protein